MIAQGRGAQIHECRVRKGETDDYEWAFVARADAPSAAAIPWLLLSTASDGPPGAFSEVTSIQRVNTSGGTVLQCLKVLGGCSLRMGRLEDARRYFGQALRQAPPARDPHNAAAMLDNLALVEKGMGRYAESLRRPQESLVQHRLLEDRAPISPTASRPLSRSDACRCSSWASPASPSYSRCRAISSRRAGCSRSA